MWLYSVEPAPRISPHYSRDQVLGISAVTKPFCPDVWGPLWFQGDFLYVSEYDRAAVSFATRKRGAFTVS